MSDLLKRVEDKLVQYNIKGVGWRIIRLRGEGIGTIGILEEVGIELKSQYATATTASRREALVAVATVVAEELKVLRAERRKRWEHYRKVDHLNRMVGGWGASGRIPAPRWVDKDPDREWGGRFDED